MTEVTENLSGKIAITPTADASASIRIHEEHATYSLQNIEEKASVLFVS